PGRCLVPMDALGLLGPEAIRIAERSRVQGLVLRLVQKGALLPFVRHGVDLVRHALHLPVRAGTRRRDVPGGMLIAWVAGVMRRRADGRQGGDFPTLVGSLHRFDRRSGPAVTRPWRR